MILIIYTKNAQNLRYGYWDIPLFLLDNKY